jgi:crotonobetainyl-CoA:carnitine CoA-transferase CaiB-like acyl-CoA transferase
VGNAHPNIAPYEPFQARDKGFVLGAANQRQWEKLCDVIRHPELKEDPRFLKNVDRVKNRDQLITALNEIFQEKDAADWLEIIQAGGLPCGPINTVPEVFAHPQSESRGYIQQVEHSTAGDISLTGFPYKLSRTPAEVHHPPPTLGEHNHEILIDLLGYSPKEVTQFEEQGVI